MASNIITTYSFSGVPGNKGFPRRNTAELRILNGDPLVAGTRYAPQLPVGLQYETEGKTGEPNVNVMVKQAGGFLSGEPMIISSASKYQDQAGATDGAAVPFASQAVFAPANLASAAADQVCFAVQDYLYDNNHVPFQTADASGLLQGISVTNAGTEIATAFFNTAKTYAPGDPLTIRAVTALVDDSANAATLEPGNTPVSGFVVDKADTSDDKVIGYVTKGVIDTSTRYGTSPYEYSLSGEPVATTTVSGADYTTGGDFAWVNDSNTEQMLQFVFRPGSIIA